MLDEEVIEGAEVICVFSDEHIDSIGRIKTVTRNEHGRIRRFTVEDLNGNLIGNSWSFPSSWDLLNKQGSKPAAKPLSLECPCGIHRADCTYHGIRGAS